MNSKTIYDDNRRGEQYLHRRIVLNALVHEGKDYVGLKSMASKEFYGATRYEFEPEVNAAYKNMVAWLMTRICERDLKHIEALKLWIASYLEKRKAFFPTSTGNEWTVQNEYDSGSEEDMDEDEIEKVRHFLEDEWGPFCKPLWAEIQCENVKVYDRGREVMVAFETHVGRVELSTCATEHSTENFGEITVDLTPWHHARELMTMAMLGAF